jgi:DNA-binding response OmpR family regulator
MPTAERVLDRVWGNVYVEERTVDVHIAGSARRY